MVISEPNRVLDGMIELLAQPGSWIQGQMAARRTGTGDLLQSDITARNANCFCLVGARQRVRNGLEKHEAPDKIRQDVNKRILSAIDTLFPDRTRVRWSLPDFNDHPETKHEDVLSVLRLARSLSTP
jgi:hypothetical protein